MGDAVSLLAGSSVDDPTREQAAAAREQQRILVTLIGKLRRERADVLVLHALMEMSAQEIGEALAVNPNTVTSRLLRARQDALAAAKRLPRDERDALAGTPLPWPLIFEPPRSSTLVLVAAGFTWIAAGATIGRTTARGERVAEAPLIAAVHEVPAGRSRPRRRAPGALRLSPAPAAPASAPVRRTGTLAQERALLDSEAPSARTRVRTRARRPRGARARVPGEHARRHARLAARPDETWARGGRARRSAPLMGAPSLTFPDPLAVLLVRAPYFPRPLRTFGEGPPTFPDPSRTFEEGPPNFPGPSCTFGECPPTFPVPSGTFGEGPPTFPDPSRTFGEGPPASRPFPFYGDLFLFFFGSPYFVLGPPSFSSSGPTFFLARLLLLGRPYFFLGLALIRPWRFFFFC